jgi:hypothetical protein
MVETYNRPWTPPEDDVFRKMAEANIRPELIAAKLNRSVPALRARAYTIGLPLKWFKLKREAARVPPIDPPPPVQRRKLTTRTSQDAT